MLGNQKLRGKYEPFENEFTRRRPIIFNIIDQLLQYERRTTCLAEELPKLETYENTLLL